MVKLEWLIYCWSGKSTDMPIPKITSIFPKIKTPSGNSGTSDIENGLDLQENTTNEATP